MGSCKSRTMIEEINQRTDEDRYNNPLLVIVPLTSEVERFMENCPLECFKEPTSSYDNITGKMINKRTSFMDLVSNGVSIVTTHALFSLFTQEIEFEIEKNKYSIVIDEEVVTIIPVNISVDMYNLLFEDSKYGVIDPKSGKVSWIGPTHEDFGVSKDLIELRELLMSNRVISFDCNTRMMFVIETPPSFFRISDSYTILTYMFDCSDLYSYFKIYGIEFEIVYQDKKIEKATKEKIRELITFIEPPKVILELSNKRKTNFSSSFWDSSKANPEFLSALRNTLGKSLNRCGAKRDKLVYACKKSLSTQAENKIQGKHLTPRGYKGFEIIKKTPEGTIKEYVSNWIPYNSKATNKYSDRNFIVYMHNVYRNVLVSKYIDTKFDPEGQIVRSSESNDRYALSVMLQCIWRTAIRNDDPISVMIFSDRMKNLFIDWLNN